MPAIPLLGWAPDADPTTPGILRNGNFVPTSRGIGGPVYGVDPYGTAGAPTPSNWAAAVVQLKTGKRNFFASPNSIWEYDPMQVSAGARWQLRFSTPFGNNVRWSFAVFGDNVYAVDKLNGLLTSTTGAFSATAVGAPQAAHVVSSGSFLMLLNLGGAGNEDAWHCSPIGNPLSSWTPSVTTQATTGRLASGPGGAITAALALGDRIVAYKSSSIFVGVYEGPPAVWRWERVPGDIGCVGSLAVADIGGAHLFVGERGIWIFDGVRPVEIGRDVCRAEMFKRFENFGSGQNVASVCYDPETGRAYIKLNISMNEVFVYDTKTQKWGVFNLGSSFRHVMALDYKNGRYFDKIARIYNFGAIFANEPLSFTTHTFGDAGRVSMAREFRAICTASIAGARTIAGACGDAQQTIAPAGAGSSSSTGSVVKWDLRQSGRWHSFTATLNGAGDSEVTAIEADIQGFGPR